MTKVTNYGLIGCGMMGQEHLRNIALLPGARVAARKKKKKKGGFKPDDYATFHERREVASEYRALDRQTREAIAASRPL